MVIFVYLFHQNFADFYKSEFCANKAQMPKMEKERFEEDA
jgi:hypothetical protein